MWCLYRRYRRQKMRSRSFWVYPINMKRERERERERERFGAFYTLFKELQTDEVKFFKCFRMSVSSFDLLHSRLKKVIQRQNTNMRSGIEPIEMLSVTIRYLASGHTFSDLGFEYRFGSSTISGIVKDVCHAIWSVMRFECVPIPGKEMWQSITEYRFLYVIYVDIGGYGKACDSHIFKNCSLWSSILNNKLEPPDEICLPGAADCKVPYFFVGDEAFALHKYLLRPYGGSNLTFKQKVLNYRLSRVQRYVECTFGILSKKWRIIHRAINLEPDFAVDQVKAGVILYNFVRERDGFEEEDIMPILGLEDLDNGQVRRGGLAANNIRNMLADYFLTQ